MTDAKDTKVTVEELVDRAEILDCLTRYSRGMDRQDRELVRSVYHPDAVDNHGGLAFTVEDFIDWAFGYHADQAMHQHAISNVSYDIDGDTAHTECYYLFTVRYPDDDRPLEQVGGRYIDRFEKRDGRWAVAARVCTTEWRTKEPSKMSMAAAAIIGAGATRDRTDPSYQRPLVVEMPS